MSADPEVVDALLARTWNASELAGRTDLGNSKRDVFVGAFVQSVREQGVLVCTCRAMERPHTPRKGCLRVFTVNTAGEATVL